MKGETFVVASPLGNIRVETCGSSICDIDLGVADALKAPVTPFGRKVAGEFSAYFSGSIKNFTVGYDPKRLTPFQREVFALIEGMRPGDTTTYGEIAKVLCTSPRAVGQALRANPYPVIIPCHRVLAKGGIGGYSGQWGQGEKLDIKKALLDMEK